MRPPAPMTRQWIGERNSFPVRGLVMYRWPNKKWACNIELLRIGREDIDRLPVDEAAYEIALSALYRYMASVTTAEFDGEFLPIKTIGGQIVNVPGAVLEVAKVLVENVKVLLADGGGAINPMVLERSSRTHSKLTGQTNVLDLPRTPRGDSRKHQIQSHEVAASKHKLKAMAARRRMLARFWRNTNDGFYQRGLVFTTNTHGFWEFNIESDRSSMDHVDDGAGEASLLDLATSVSRNAIAAFASASNYEKNGERHLRGDLRQVMVPEALSNEMLNSASASLARKLVKEMTKQKHGVVGLRVLERCLAVAWDPEDTKPLEEYPFPTAPSAIPQALDRWALDVMQTAQRSAKQAAKAAEDVGGAGAATQPGNTKSWREELEIEDWVPLDDQFEDDETIDRRAMGLADHDQSAALRRIRGDKVPEGMNHAASITQHDIDYEGLPKDDQTET
jgi:hypothetical protein